MPTVRVEFNERELRALLRVTPGVRRAMRKAWATALRDMRSEASKRVRQRKRIKARFVHRALVLRKPTGDPTATAAGIDVRGEAMPLSAYAIREKRQGVMHRGSRARAISYTRGAGVSAQVNVGGKRAFIRSAFIATLKSGHKGVFVRRGIKRLPIDELFTSRPVDPLFDQGNAQGVAERGAGSLVSAFSRLLAMEIAKEGKGG